MSFYIAWVEGFVIVAFIISVLCVAWYDNRRHAYRKRISETEGRYVP